MDITIIERLKEYIEHEKISPPELYKKIGAHRGIWSGWVNQGKAISIEKLVAIINALPKLNSRWLFTGVGDMLDSNLNHDILNKNTNGSSQCNECISKDNEIKALKIALSAKEELLEIYKGKTVISLIQMDNKQKLKEHKLKKIE